MLAAGLTARGQSASGPGLDCWPVTRIAFARAGGLNFPSAFRLPPRVTAAFEFRNASWMDDEVFDALKAKNAALCIADIAKWTGIARQLAGQACDAYIHFKHEGEGKGAAFGQRTMALLKGES
jgi:Protein of unknown function DUF72